MLRIEKRRSVSKSFDNGTLWFKDGDYIEVTEWTNGEGYDIDLSGQHKISIGYHEWKELKKLIKFLENN
jgi:hypothetical protein